MATDREILIKVNADAQKANEGLKKTGEEIGVVQKYIDGLSKSGDRYINMITAAQGRLEELKNEQKEYEGQLTQLESTQKQSINNYQQLESILARTNKSQADYEDQTTNLIALRKQLNTDDVTYQQSLDAINKKLAENKQWTADMENGNKQAITTMGDYKTRITESFDAINIFNGGISGFVSRAQEAGGVGALFKTSLSGMTEGFKGMGKAIMANPFGFFLSLLAPLIEKLMSMPPVTNAVQKAMAALDPVMKLLSKPLEMLANLVGWLIEGFADMVGAFTDYIGISNEAGNAAEELANAQENLKKSQEALSAAMAVQEERNAQAKQDIDDLMKKANDQTKSEQERISALTEAHAIEKKNLEERKKLANDAYDQAIRNAIVNKNLSIEELNNLVAGGAAYAEKMMKVKGFTKEEIEALQKANTERIRLGGEEKQMLQKQEGDRQKIADEARAKREAAEQQWRQKQEKQRQDALTHQKLELDMFIANQGNKARTMAEELSLAEDVHKKKMAIINAEYAASDKSANAKLQRDIALKEAENDIAAQRAQLAVDNAGKELQAYMQASKSRIEDGKALTNELVQQEKTRLQQLLTEQSKYEKTRLDNGIITQQQYNEAISKLESDKLAADKKLDDDYIKQGNDEKAAKAVEDYEKSKANAATNFELQRIEEQQRHLTVIADLDKQLADHKITKEKYDELEKEENKKNAEENKRINKASFDNKLDLANQTFGSLQAILGKESAAGKAMAVAQATIDTYKSATAAYASMATIPVVGPALGAVAAAAAVAAGIANVKKITSTKAPKAEKGALFSIGGQRHSAGGTLFTGADGTQFEAEHGELIGVMNRNAAQHFMAFNNAFPAGSGGAPNYFASGGIVSREVSQQGLNVDELAAKIAQANSAIPAPVVAVQDIITRGDSYVRVREGANF